MGSQARSFTNNGLVFDTCPGNWKNGCRESVSKRCDTRATVLGAMKNMTFKPFYGSQLETVVPKSTTKGEKFGLLSAGIGDRTGDAFTSRL